MLDRIQWSTGPATGAAGSATATAYSPHLAGQILAVHIAYHDTPPATTDLTLTGEADPASENILTLANANTDTKIYPRRPIQTNDGTAITYDGTRPVCAPYAAHGRLKATIAQANAGDSVTVTVWLET